MKMVSVYLFIGKEHLICDPCIWLKVTSMASTLHSLQPFKFYFAHFTMKHPVARMMNRLDFRVHSRFEFLFGDFKDEKNLTVEIKKVLKNV